MSSQFNTEARALLSSERFIQAKRELLQAIEDSTSKLRQVKPGNSSPEAREAYLAAVKEFSRDRGRDLYYPFIASGVGSGPFVELLDGSVKYDMVTGIGINFFGHSHPDLMSEMVDALSADVMQGNLEPGHEPKDLLRAMLARTGEGSRLKHGWIMCSGTMVNEVALKIIRQKKHPATKVMAFKDCFHGRSTAMQELTDNPGYRQNQPVYGEAHYLSFYDPRKGLEGSVAQTVGELKEAVVRYPGRFATLLIELVQGEGGFNYAPREWYTRVFDEARKAGMAIWADEVQTFGRTGELFAYQKFGLSEYMDVVTVGKMLQACMVLFTEEFNPKPGLVAGTFSGSTVALRTARRVLEILTSPGYLGKEGKIERLSARFTSNLAKLSEGSCKGRISEIRGIGGLIAFAPHAGTMEDVKGMLTRLFDLGVVAFYCGHGPYLIRLLPPLAVMSEQDVDGVCAIIEKALLQPPGAAK